MDGFDIIREKVMGWDLKPVMGRGAYIKYTGKYGHVELELSKNENSEENQIIWDVPSGQVPIEMKFEPFVELAIMKFFEYFRQCREAKIPLKAKVFDASYHPVDSQDKHYEIAALIALIDCFDSGIHSFKSEIVYRIKQNTITGLRNRN